MPLPPALFVVWWSILGLVVGSFLNVVIHRWPLEDETIRHPRRSRCPSCHTELGWKENIPLLSWVVQRGRCKHCSWPIPWRYPLVELLNGCLWGVAAASAPGAWGLIVVHSIVLAGLVVATFVDFAHFEIPDEVSIGGMVLAPVAALLVPELHQGTWLAQQLGEDGTLDRTSALIACLAGMAVGGGLLLAIGALGKVLFGRDAMGLGDVKLLAAGGGFVGPGGAAVALLLGSLIASLVGLANMIRFACLSRRRVRDRRVTKPFSRSLQTARVAARYIPFGPYLGIGIGIVLLAWNDVSELLRELVYLP
jgi:leader peptidase (prepilin peptidase)/N-methyltransferase